MEELNLSAAEYGRNLELRQMLLNSAKKKCAPFEKKVRESMAEKYPLGMTPFDIANEIELNVEDSGYTAQMPNVNLSASSMEGAIIEGQSQEIMDMLVSLALKTDDLYISAVAVDMHDRIAKYEQIEPAKMHNELAIEQERVLAELDRLESDAEMRAAIREDNEELRDAIKETNEEYRAAERESQGEKKPFLESPKKLLKRAMNLDVDR